jgi:type VI secretion system protein ImpA
MGQHSIPAWIIILYRTLRNSKLSSWSRGMQDIDIGINWDAPISADFPAGPDMQYSPEFAELEAAATGTPEQQYGSVLIPAKAPEWQHVLELAAKLSGETQDLRVLLQILRALTRLHGLLGLKAGLGILESLLKHRWEHVHPQIVIDGQEDPQVRFGVLAEFTAVDGLVGDVRQAVALQTPLGAFTVRDLERIVDQGSVELNGVSVSRDQLDQMVCDLGQSEAATLRLPGQLVHLLGEMRDGIEARSGPEFTPDLTFLKRPLERVSSLLQSAMQLGAETGEPVEAGELAASATDSLSIPGTLTSRAAVIKAMDAICAYLERNEPTNPVPLLIRRARRLMDMSFLDIVKDVSPDGVNQVMFLVGDIEGGPAS